jgi:hypothetical protein
VGTGVDLFRALSARSAALTVVLAAGCIDFVEPDIAELGAAAVAQVTIRLTDLGTVEINARVAPGLDAAGFRRSVEDPLEVFDRIIEPDSVTRNGTRIYLETWQASPDIVADTVRFQAPAVHPVTAPPPAVQWLGIRRAGSDTASLDEGDDLRLAIRLTEGDARPQPQIQQWFLRLGTDSSAFNISADGVPPDTLRVPAHWIPPGDSIGVRLIFNQSAVLREPPGDYMGVITVDTRLFWTVRRRSVVAAQRPVQ